MDRPAYAIGLILLTCLLGLLYGVRRLFEKIKQVEEDYVRLGLAYRKPIP